MITFIDTQEPTSPRSGTAVKGTADLVQLMSTFRGRRPFFFMLEGDQGKSLLVGVGPRVGCAQFTDENAIATMAVPAAPRKADGFIEFLTGNTPTPVPARFCMPMPEVQKIASWFIDRSGRDPAVAWETV